MIIFYIIFYIQGCTFTPTSPNDREGCVLGNCQNGIGVVNKYNTFQKNKNNLSSRTIDTKYEGNFLNGRRHGKGKLTVFWHDWHGTIAIVGVYPSVIYIGKWKNGYLNGHVIRGSNYNTKSKMYQKAKILIYYRGKRIQGKPYNVNSGLTLNDLLEARIAPDTAKKIYKVLNNANQYK